jgi:hypothetical protein
MISSIDKELPKEIREVKNFCENIEYPFWNLECNYLLADELALIRPASKIHLEEISSLCERATKVGIIPTCFDHVLLLIPDEKKLEFCEISKNKIGAWKCYYAFGREFLENNNYNIEPSLVQCEKLPFEMVNHCKESVFYNYGQSSSENIEKIVSKCLDSPVNFRSSCLTGASLKVVDNCDGSVKDCASR